MIVINHLSVDMYLQYLLAVLVVLLGNFQIISTGNEQDPAHNTSLPKGSSSETNQEKYSSKRLNTQNEMNRENSKAKEGVIINKDVKELHDPFNILQKINKTGTVHKYSITPEDFAQVTYSLNATCKDSSPMSNDLPKLDSNGDEDTLSLLIVPVQDIAVDSYKLFNNLEDISADKSLDGMKSEVQMITPSTAALTNSLLEETFVESNNSSLPNTIVFTDAEGKLGNNNDDSYDKLYSNLTFEELATKIKDDIKTYSNEAVIEWEEIKDRVSKNNEVSHVLNDYHDKIAISQAVNNSECVKSHETKYETRVNFLNDVLQACESQLRRETWNELQNKTKELLNVINSMVQKTDVAEGKFEDDKIDQLTWSKEKETKQRLDLLDVDSKTQALSELKKNALIVDEEEYTDCIIQNTGQEIVVDTLNDIMKIKNNCVG